MTTQAIETPLMKQYNGFKARYPDAILLFRIGDFYETFGQDAVKASAALGIVLTRRSNGAAADIELAGFPHHALDTYLPRLVRAGYRVAICDQMEDPKTAKKIVKRGVTEVVTPGVALGDKLLDHKQNNFLAAVHLDGLSTGIAFADISTGEFYAAEGSQEYADRLLQSFRPAEVLYARPKAGEFVSGFGDKFYTYPLDEWAFSPEYGREVLLKHFRTASLKGFGIEEMTSGIAAAGAVLHYLAATEHPHIGHLASISRVDPDAFMWLDKFTVRNLELLQAPAENATPLVNILDRTRTPMGARMLRRWMLMPLRDKAQIEERLEVVEHLTGFQQLHRDIQLMLTRIGDLERLVSRVAMQKVNPREVLQLKQSLIAVEELKHECASSGNLSIQALAGQLNPCRDIVVRIERELSSDPPAQVEKGNVMAAGVSPELDELRRIAYSGKDYLLQIQKKEIERTGITSLKIGFNSVFGYYLEVTHAHKHKVPPEWVRKQTLTNAERYITDELKQYEEKILGAEERILAIESTLFGELVLGLCSYVEAVQLDCTLVARLDCLSSFAEVSRDNDYRKPVLEDSHVLDIREGRHPVIEKILPPGEKYVPNDVCLDRDTCQVIIITGPNMSGKSALLRQTALIVIMAQMGCFVPAASARIGVVDKVFTRVGASDNISSGESTFMVEMNETASILNNISPGSLILLDEIGRGTSTYDGVSLAWAIAEYLHDHGDIRPKTLFATHYHELNDLAAYLPRVKNYNVSVRETGNKVIFLRKLAEGGSEHSFGIHVARMAGIPPTVVRRAEEVLASLEKDRGTGKRQAIQATPASNGATAGDDPGFQLSLFRLNDPVLAKIRQEIEETDIDNLTPVQALMKMHEIKRLLGNF